MPVFKKEHLDTPARLWLRLRTSRLRIHAHKRWAQAEESDLTHDKSG
jgi:hypothetical protein